MRETVRQLWHEKKNSRRYDEVIALIQAALRHNQAQPWMYEALLAVTPGRRSAQGRDRAGRDVRRRVRGEPMGFDVHRHVPERLDLKPRALQVFRQVSQIVPMVPEPYVEGLRVAQDLNDKDGVQWAAVGILCRSGPRN